MVMCTQSQDHLKVMLGSGQSMALGLPLFPFFKEKTLQFDMRTNCIYINKKRIETY
jgi:hypothetical protein